MDAFGGRIVPATVAAAAKTRGGQRADPPPSFLPSAPSWKADGTLFLTNMRLVFVAAPTKKPDPAGLASFALPLALITPDTEFKQPIFACNQLKGRVWQAGEGGGAGGGLPPHAFRLEFRGGGVGTFLPLYFRFLEYLRAVARGAAGEGVAWSPPAAAAPAAAAPAAPAGPPRPVEPVWPTAAPPVAAGTAFVDPSDPSKLFLTAPVTTDSAGPPPAWPCAGGPPAPK